MARRSLDLQARRGAVGHGEDWTEGALQAWYVRGRRGMARHGEAS